MKLFPAIGVPLDGSDVALRSLGCATWLASRLGAKLHVLNVNTPLPRDQALQRLRVPEKYRPLVEFHQVQGDTVDEILAAAERHGIGLIVMTAQGTSGATAAPDPLKIVGHVTHGVIERSRVPVLLLPPRYEESLPWRTALVPLSGEPGADESLTVALRLAHVLDLAVTVAHVAATGERRGEAGSGLYADEAYHEYPQMLNEFVARACPLCSAAEREHIVDFRLFYGDVADALLALIERNRTSLLVVGWHGQFMTGHAHVLKAMIQRLACPVLLVKAVPRAPVRLKVGEELSG